MAEPIIEIQALGKVFQGKGGSFCALDEIDLTINRGDIFGIIGMSGAGKSTLVRCINMLERPTSGTVIFDGKNLMDMPMRQLRAARRSMGMIFQQFNLLMQRTAEANIRFPLEIAGVPQAKARKRAAELLELVGLSERANYYPSQLSGGQKQRVAIARALATEPKVLLCDEATSALDPSTTASILALLKDINRRLSITVVIITHEMSVIEQICNRVAIISASRIAETGTVQDVFSRPRTEAARQLVLPEGKTGIQAAAKGQNSFAIGQLAGALYRVVFDGASSFEPIIANMVLACRAPVSIIFADMHDIDGKAFGHMVLRLPEDSLTVNRMITYMKEHGLTLEEVHDV